MKKGFLLLLLVFITKLSFAADRRLTKEEFLERVEKGSVTLEKAPVLSIPNNVIDKVFASQRKAFPAFKPEMFYVGYIKDNKFIYSLFFDWTVNRCLLRIEELDSKTGKPNEKTMDPTGQPVGKNYCEKALGIKL